MGAVTLANYLKQLLRAWLGDGAPEPPPNEWEASAQETVDANRAPPRYQQERTGGEILPPEGR